MHGNVIINMLLITFPCTKVFYQSCLSISKIILLWAGINFVHPAITTIRNSIHQDLACKIEIFYSNFQNEIHDTRQICHMSRVAFPRSSARIGVRGSSQSWQCQDFESASFGNPSLTVLLFYRSNRCVKLKILSSTSYSWSA